MLLRSALLLLYAASSGRAQSSCATTTSRYTCSHLISNAMWAGSGSWSEQLGSEKICGASPRPCTKTTFLGAVEQCRAVGGRLKTRSIIPRSNMVPRSIGGIETEYTVRL